MASVDRGPAELIITLYLHHNNAIDYDYGQRKSTGEYGMYCKEYGKA